MKKIFTILLLAIAVSLQAQHWGEQGDGTFCNPILPTDLSDPDVIRVGDRYYMVASDFHFLGMQILESSDMVNWHVVTQLYDRFNFPGWDMQAVRGLPASVGTMAGSGSISARPTKDCS